MPPGVAVSQRLPLAAMLGNTNFWARRTQALVFRCIFVPELKMPTIRHSIIRTQVNAFFDAPFQFIMFTKVIAFM